MTMFVLWLTGLPGSGKSTVARALMRELRKRRIKAYHLQMDKVRKHLTPNPKYTEKERDFAYRSLVVIACLLSQETNVIIDATAHRRKWRELARKMIKNYREVYVKCPMDVAIERETGRKSRLVVRNIYKKRLKGKKMRQVIGIDVKYEKGSPDVVVDSANTSPREAARIILRKL